MFCYQHVFRIRLDVGCRRFLTEACLSSRVAVAGMAMLMDDSRIPRQVDAMRDAANEEMAWM